MARRITKTKKDKIRKDEEAEKLLKLDLGCGQNKREGFLGVDKVKVDGVSFVQDLFQFPWPWKDASVEEIHTSHFFEHIPQMVRPKFMDECYRILIPGGKMSVIVPYYSSMRAVQDYNHCYMPDTEVLTASGFVPITSVSIGDRILTLDPETLKSEWRPCVATVRNDFEGNMLHFKTDRLDLMVTPDHHMFWSTIGAQEARYKLERADTILSMKGHHERRGLGVIPQIMAGPPGKTMPAVFGRNPKAFAEFVGWWLAEGWLDGYDGHYRIPVGQSLQANPERVKRISAVMTDLGMKPQVKPSMNRIVCNSKSMYGYLEQFGHGSHQKRIPDHVRQWPLELLRPLLYGYMEGDGTPNGSGWNCGSVSKTLADGIQEIALKIGYRAKQYTEHRERTTFGGAYDIHMVSVKKESDVYFPRPVLVPYSGPVVCLTVDKNHVILVRRNGTVIWCGNCWPPICEASFLYFNREWRKVNKLDHYEVHCDFDFGYGYAISPELQGRNQEYKDVAVRNYINSVMDLHVNLTKK